MTLLIEFAPEATEHTKAPWCVVWRGKSFIVLGVEIRPNFPADHQRFPGCGGAFGVVVLGVWVGFVKEC